MGIENNISNTKPKEKVSQRLWLTNELGMKVWFKSITVEGKENIKAIPEGAKVVIMPTHLTDLDVTLAIHAVARELNVSVMNVSIHHKFWGPQGEKGTNLSLHIAGKKNFLPIDFINRESGDKDPKMFNPENFERAAKDMEAGKGIIISVHRGKQEALEDLDDVRGGYGGVYLASLAPNTYILPITVKLDKPSGMYADPMKTLKNRPNASVLIGKPFQLEKTEGMEHLSEIDKKRKEGKELTKEDREEFSRLADALREKSKGVMKRMSEQLAIQTKKLAK